MKRIGDGILYDGLMRELLLIDTPCGGMRRENHGSKICVHCAPVSEADLLAWFRRMDDADRLRAKFLIALAVDRFNLPISLWGDDGRFLPLEVRDAVGGVS